MKNLYIPKGKTLHYETLYCQNIVNDGTLIVDGTLPVSYTHLTLPTKA